MKKNVLKILTFILIIWGFLSCGSPNEPFNEDNGGYKKITTFSTFGNANNLLVEDTLLYVAQGEGGLEIISVKDRKKPHVISMATENARGYSYALAKYDSIIYLAAGNFGITVVNVASSQNPIVTAFNLTMKPARGLLINNGFLFVAISERGVQIASLSYPLEPDIRGTFQTPGYAQNLAITNDNNYALVANGEMGLAVFDISDFVGGFGEYPQIGWIDTDGYAENIVLDETNKIAYLACGTAGIYSINYADFNSLSIIDNFNSHGYAKDLKYDNGNLYVASENGGVYFLSVSADGIISEKGKILTNDARGIAFDNNYIYVADKEEGIIIIQKP